MIGLIGLCLLCYSLGYKNGKKKAEEDIHKKALYNRYHLVYAPIRTLFIGSHIITSEVIRYPKFSQRLERALINLKNKRLPMYERFLNSLKLSYDKGTKRSGEVEYGSGIPIKKIKEIISKNGQWADAKLLDLVNRADKSEYECKSYTFFDDDITQQYLDLLDNIFKTYNSLYKNVMPK